MRDWTPTFARSANIESHPDYSQILCAGFAGFKDSEDFVILTPANPQRAVRIGWTGG